MQRGDANATIVAFPEGLHMFTGDPYVRNNTGSDESKAISWKWSVSSFLRVPHSKLIRKQIKHRLQRPGSAANARI
jgi:hypothetical protein